MDLSNTSNLSKTEESLTQQQNTLPNELWYNDIPLHFYHGFWAPHLERIQSFINHFQAQNTDIITTSFRKVGTTWLKSLVFTISNRTIHPPSNNHPLLTHNPHKLVPQFESNIYAKSKNPDLNTIKSPRIFGTHVPFPSLPDSIKQSKCKIIYIFRNPFDTFVSSWMFYPNMDDHKSIKSHMIGEFFDRFCEGRIPFGPFPEHVLGYWKASVEQPEKVLFIRYEDLKVDPKPQLTKMAEFLGCPFTKEEEGGLIDDIVELCSFKKLKEVAIKNVDGRVHPTIQNELFFRKGEVGDWVNYLTPLMADKLRKIMEEKFCGSGLMY